MNDLINELPKTYQTPTMAPFCKDEEKYQVVNELIKKVEEIKFEVPDQNTIIVSGIDKALVGEVAANIRAIKPPEPYKGKGIRYKDEYVRRKAGKAAVTAGA